MMIKYFTIVLLSLTLTCCNLLAQEQLPVGSHPPAIAFEHFPNRVYALVWRNWNLVEPVRIAQTIDCNVEDVNAVAAYEKQNYQIFPGQLQYINKRNQTNYVPNL